MKTDYQHSILGNEAIKANRDERKAVAIICYDAGLEAQEIAKQMGLSTRTVNRYLESHIAITPADIHEGLRVHLIEEMKGKPMYRAPGTHYWVIRKLFTREGDPYAELERRGEHPNGTAYLQVRISRLLTVATKGRCYSVIR